MPDIPEVNALIIPELQPSTTTKIYRKLSLPRGVPDFAVVH